MLATNFQAITHPDDLETDLAYVKQLLAGEVPTYQMEKRYIHKLGFIVWIQLSVSLVRDVDSRPLHFISQIQNVTDRNRVAAELRESQARLQAILDHSPTLIFLKDTEGRYLLVNRQFETAFHLASKDIVGKTDAEIFPLNRPLPSGSTTTRSSKRALLCNLKKLRWRMMDCTRVLSSSFRCVRWMDIPMPCAELRPISRSANRLRRRSDRVKRDIVSSLS
jgi:PAS domain-containing protein